MARTGEMGAKGISAFLVEKGTKGLSFGKNEQKMGWQAQPTAQVIFEDCQIPRENLIGEIGSGFKYAMAGLDGGRLNIAACSVGGAASALSRAFEYSKQRSQFGKQIGDFKTPNSNLLIWRPNSKPRANYYIMPQKLLIMVTQMRQNSVLWQSAS